MLKNKINNLKVKIIKHFFSANKWVNYLGVSFGERCKFNKEISFGSEPYLTTIGDDFYCAAGVKFIPHDGSINVLRNLYKELENADIFGRITIGNNVFIGADVIVLAGSNIGNNVIVGAGAVVKGVLESGYVYAGIPAKKICSIEDYLKKNKSSIHHVKGLNKEKKKHYLINSEL